MQSGNCQCGAVEYLFSGTPMTCIACHCTDCQSGSGSAFSISMVVQTEDLKVHSGTLEEDSFQLNGNQLVRVRCGICGTGLWYYNTAMPEVVALKPGTFKDTSWFTPVAHCWTRSAQPWFRFDPDTPRYETQPDITELIALWQQQGNC